MFAMIQPCTFLIVFAASFIRDGCMQTAGLFIARISKGRTVGQLISTAMLTPVMYTFVWFAVFGGTGLNMERMAIHDGCLGKCQVRIHVSADSFRHSRTSAHAHNHFAELLETC